MTIQTQAVLRVLLDDIAGQHYSLKIAKHLDFPTGTVHPILSRLEEAGWVTSDWEQIDPHVEGRRPRRYYQLTEFGREQAQAALGDTLRMITPRSLAEDLQAATVTTSPSGGRS